MVEKRIVRKSTQSLAQKGGDALAKDNQEHSYDIGYRAGKDYALDFPGKRSWELEKEVKRRLKKLRRSVTLDEQAYSSGFYDGYASIKGR
jgi:hypothetical protein